MVDPEQSGRDAIDARSGGYSLGWMAGARLCAILSFVWDQFAMSDHTTKIDLIEDADATGEVAKVYDEWRSHSGRQQMPGILKCFSHRPDFLREVMSFSNTVHFSEGHLDRRTKEAIASWVSWLNRCPY
jgi:hypothetical protein